MDQIEECIRVIFDSDIVHVNTHVASSWTDWSQS